MLRTFIALPISASMKSGFHDAIEPLRSALPAGVRWVPEENIHLTVKFLGEQPAARIDAMKPLLQSLVQRIPPMSLTVGGVGCFPSPSRPRVLWIGLEEPTGTLKRLVMDLEQTLESLGVEPERRSFHPHLTFARIKKPLSKGELERFRHQLDALHMITFGEEIVNELVLFRSDLRREGPLYSALHTFPFEGGT